MSPMGLASYADKVRLAIISKNKDINIPELYKYTTKMNYLPTKHSSEKLHFIKNSTTILRRKSKSPLLIDAVTTIGRSDDL